MSLADITGKASPPPPPPGPRSRNAGKILPRQAVREPAPLAAQMAATVAPGQTLLLAVREVTTPEQAAAIAEQVKTRLPGVEVVVLAGIEQMAVYDPARPPA